MVSLEDPKVPARGFKGQSYRDQSFSELAGMGTFYMVQAIEKGIAPFALKLFFPLPLYGFALFSLGVPSYLFFLPPPELSGLALRVTAPLIVLAVSKMVCCLLSVGSLLLNAASGTPEHLDQSIGLSWPYFPHCPHPGDVCNNWREHTSPRVIGCRARTQPPAAAVIQLCAFWWGEGAYARGRCLPQQCHLLPGHAPGAPSRHGAGLLEGCVVNSSPFAGNSLLSVGTGCCETAWNEVGR